MQRLDDILERVTMALAVFACAIIAFIFSLIVTDVTIRMLGFTPPSFTLAVVEYALLYFAMSAAPYLVRHRGHVTIEALVSVLPAGVRKVLAKIVYAVCMGVSFLFAYYAALLLIEAYASQQQDLRGIDMPYWTLYLPMPFCFVMVALEFLRYLLGRASMYSYDLGEVRDSV